MQLVIEIPEGYYKAIKEIPVKQLTVDMLVIRNGIPLPKRHGRLKDVDAFLSKVKADREHSAYVISWTADDVLNVLNNSYTPTIIEADNIESESKE